MLKVLLVGMGGFLGATMRYLTGGLVHQLVKNNYFPYGTLAVNLLGCFLIGLLAGLAENRQLFNPEVRLLVFIGFLGSFTTYSTFGYEVFGFAQDGQILSAAANVALHLVCGIGAVWFGQMLSKII